MLKFRGGASKYKDFRNYVYVGVETVANGEKKGEFSVRMKIMKEYASVSCSCRKPADRHLGPPSEDQHHYRS